VPDSAFGHPVDAVVNQEHRFPASRL
jgi:hypothetical protein